MYRACKSFTRDDDSKSMAKWHDPESDTSAVLMPTKSMRKAADKKGVNTIRFNSAHSGGCICCPRHGEDCPGSPVNGHKPMPGTEHCEGRCKIGFRVCTSANSSWEEFCVFNPSRIHQIEILDGPEDLIGYGKGYWDVNQATRDDVTKQRLAELDAEAENAEKASLAVVQAQLSRENAAYVTITGAVRFKCNGLFRQALAPHKGIARYESDLGWHLFYYEAMDSWRISSTFKPEGTGCFAYVSSDVGKLPTGEQTWKQHDGNKWIDDQKVTVTLWSEQHKEAAEKQAAEDYTELMKPQAEAACAQVDDQGVAGIRIDGAPGKEDNSGVFVLVEERHEGWPRFRNERGMQLFRQVQVEEWYIGPDFTPNTRAHSIPKVHTMDGTIPFLSGKTTGKPGEHGVWFYYENKKFTKYKVTLTVLSDDEVAAEQEKVAVAKEAALIVAHEQLMSVGAVVVTGCLKRICDGTYSKLSDELVRTTTPSWLRPQNRPAAQRKMTFPKFRNAEGMYLFHYHPEGAVHSWNITADIENTSKDEVLARFVPAPIPMSMADIHQRMVDRVMAIQSGATGLSAGALDMDLRAAVGVPESESAPVPGTLPVGQSDWRCRAGTRWNERQVTVSLMSEEDAAAAIAIEEQAASMAVANAWGQLKDVNAIQVEGTSLNSKRIAGVYEPSSEQGDCPCFQNEHGMYLWYCKARSRSSWHISVNEATEADPLYTMQVTADDGRLLTGKNSWSKMDSSLEPVAKQLEVTLLSGDEAVSAVETAKADKKKTVDKLLADALAQLAEVDALEIGGFPKGSVHSTTLGYEVEISSFNGVYKPTGDFTARGFPIFKLDHDEHQRFLYGRLALFDTNFEYKFNSELTPEESTSWARGGAADRGSMPVSSSYFQYFNGGHEFRAFSLKVQRRYKDGVDVAAKWAKRIAEVKAKGVSAKVTTAGLADTVEAADGDVNRAHKMLLQEESRKVRLMLLREPAQKQAASGDALVVGGFPAMTVAKYQGKDVDAVDVSSFNGKYTHVDGELTGDGLPVWRRVAAGATGERVLYRCDDVFVEGGEMHSVHTGWVFNTVVRPRPEDSGDAEWAVGWAYDPQSRRMLEKGIEPPGKGAVPIGKAMRWGYNAGETNSFSAVDLTITDRNLRNEMLIEFAHSGETAEVLRLLDEGVDVDSENHETRTALYFAAKSNYPGCIKALIAHGADIEKTVGKRKTTPIMIAAFNGHSSAMECLLDAGAKWKKVDADGQTVYYMAHDDGKAALTGWVARHGTEEDKTKMQEELLRDAAYDGHMKEVERLLAAAGTDVNAVDEGGMSPLFVAAWKGRVAAMKVLIDAGASVNVAQQEGKTPLMAAAWNCHIEAVELLLTAGADARMVNKDGATALDRAKQFKCTKCVAALEAWGENPGRSRRR